MQGNNGGVYFGDAPIGSYRIDISSSGAYTLYQYTRSNNQFNLLQSRSSPAIKTGLNQVNVLTAIVHNSNLYLYVNTQFVTSYFLSAYAQGGGGFTALSINQATDVAFSNLKVWTL